MMFLSKPTETSSNWLHGENTSPEHGAVWPPAPTSNRHSWVFVLESHMYSAPSSHAPANRLRRNGLNCNWFSAYRYDTIQYNSSCISSSSNSRVEWTIDTCRLRQNGPNCNWSADYRNNQLYNRWLLHCPPESYPPTYFLTMIQKYSPCKWSHEEISCMKGVIIKKRHEICPVSIN